MDQKASDLLQHSAITKLLVEERYFRDTCQWQRLRACFHPDASKTRVNISWTDGNIDEFVKGSEQMSHKGTSATHTITPVDVHINGRKAVAESVGSIQVRFEIEGHEYDLMSYCRFVATLEQLGDLDWKMLELTAIYLRDVISPVAPTGETLSINVASNRESYKYLTWLFTRRGFSIRDDLPGIDKPETVDKLMNTFMTWLKL